MKRMFTKYVGNQGPGLGQAQQCGRVKPVNGMIQILPSWYHISRCFRMQFHQYFLHLACYKGGILQEHFFLPFTFTSWGSIFFPLIFLKLLNIQYNFNILHIVCVWTRKKHFPDDILDLRYLAKVVTFSILLRNSHTMI